MNPSNQFNPVNLIMSLSATLELSNPGILKHHLGVAYISQVIAEELDLPNDRITNLVFAALIHDIGAAIHWNEKQQIIIDDNDDFIFEHTLEGYKILKESTFFNHIADIVKLHHNRYAGSNPDNLMGEKIPLESRIIYLADRIDLMIDQDSPIQNQVNSIINTLLSSENFDPKLVQLFINVSKDDLFWNRLSHISDNDQFLQDLSTHNQMSYELADLISIASTYSKLVDAKSAFTARHSENVANVAEYLSKLFGYSDDEAAYFYLAGLLHDLGKLVVPNEIIDKEGPLSEEEYDLIKKHSYFSKMVIEKVDGFEEIANWLGEHHERLDGSGYPDHLSAEQISHQSRIIQISDVFSALSEHRPYRISLDNEEVLSKMRLMVEENQLDSTLMKALEDHVEQFRNLIDVRLRDAENMNNAFYFDS